MVEHHYEHLAPSFIVDAIRAGAAVYGINAEDKRGAAASEKLCRS